MAACNADSIETNNMIKQLVDKFQPGYSLPGAFYTSPELYQKDLQLYWGRNWIWAGHVSQLPEAGSYFLFDFGSESIIVVRDKGGQIRAHLNVCRHRGSRVCLQQTGKANSFVCPYHAWTYNLDGGLRSGRLMPAEFDKNQHGLKPVKLFEFQGLLFICMSDDPPPIEHELAAIAPLTAPFDLARLKIAHQESYPVSANWKLALENYLECYHCAPSHKQYSKSHSLKDPDSMTEELVQAMQARSADIGLPVTEISATGEMAQAVCTDLYYRRYPLYPGYDTGSQDGTAIAPLLGSLKGFDGGATDLMIGPLNSFLIYADHMVAYRFIPTGVQTTDIQTLWLVNEDSREGVDYDLENLKWLWDVTTQDDERIIRHNQEGVNSSYYRPGPLSTMEWGIADFHAGYLGLLREPLELD